MVQGRRMDRLELSDGSGIIEQEKAWTILSPSSNAFVRKARLCGYRETNEN